MAKRSVHPSRRKFKRAKSLHAFLRAYGRGEEGRTARNAFALRVGTTIPYLEQICVGVRRASMELAVEIELATHGMVRADELHPSKHWGYLAARKQRPGQLQRRENSIA